MYVEHPGIGLKALNVVVERYYDALFDVQEAIEVFGC